MPEYSHRRKTGFPLGESKEGGVYTYRGPETRIDAVGGLTGFHAFRAKTIAETETIGC
jgi:hypothetical protein